LGLFDVEKYDFKEFDNCFNDTGHCCDDCQIYTCDPKVKHKLYSIDLVVVKYHDTLNPNDTKDVDSLGEHLNFAVVYSFDDNIECQK
jgi:hypothetical protein